MDKNFKLIIPRVVYGATGILVKNDTTTLKLAISQILDMATTMSICTREIKTHVHRKLVIERL